MAKRNFSDELKRHAAARITERGHPLLFGRDPGLPACLKADLRLRLTAVSSCRFVIGPSRAISWGHSVNLKAAQQSKLFGRRKLNF